MQSNAIRLDFRSDTVTRPTAQMRAAMAAADVGDDVLGDDFTVHSLEARVAAMFGKDSGLLLPTDHPPWPNDSFTLPQFFKALNAWTPQSGEQPGKQRIFERVRRSEADMAAFGRYHPIARGPAHKLRDA